MGRGEESPMVDIDMLRGVTHLSEIVNDVINGIVAFIFYWPIIWLLFQYGNVYKTPLIDVFGSSYVQLAGIGGASWLGILLAVPFVGLLNRAINNAFVGTVQKYISTIPLIRKIPLFIRMITIRTIRKQYDFLIGEEELLKIDDSLYPCWKLQGTFDFVNYRHWIINNVSRKNYWDWEHFLDWVYKMYYQTFLLFLTIYSAILIIIAVIFGIQSFINMNLPSLAVFFLVFPTYALYREYLMHHFAWIRMDQKFYVDYLVETKEYIDDDVKNDIKKYLEDENYEKLGETMREHCGKTNNGASPSMNKKYSLQK